MDRCRVALVIPALNEEKTIYEVVKESLKFGLVVVVDDGSVDQTAKFAELGGAVVVSHEKNKGYDSALNSGFIKAESLGCEYIITLDADGQHNPKLIHKFIESLLNGSDIVIGIRNKRQRFGEHLFSWYANLRFGIKDPLCGMKAYRSDLYRDQGYFDKNNLIGTELMFFAAKRKYKLQQIPFKVSERNDKSRFGRNILGNLKIIRALLISI